MASRAKLPQTASGMNLASPIVSNAPSSQGDQQNEIQQEMKSPQIEIDYASSIEKPSAAQPDQP